MSHFVQARLVNGPWGDPGLYLEVRHGRRALLLDLPDVSALSPRELLRVSDIFLSHRHMDHFAGFDTLLRLHLHRPGTIRLVGPGGTIAAVAARLASYSWNLLGEGSADFALHVAEFAQGVLGPWTAFRARAAFRPAPVARPTAPPGLAREEDDFRMEVVELDHGIPSLAFALQERRRIHVDTEGLARLGLSVGPWLNTAKTAIRRGDPDDTPVRTAEGRDMPLGALREAAFRTAPGQRIAYVTDAAPTSLNAQAIAALASGADQLFIEAPFLEEDGALARERRHLTAALAGRLARQAGAKQAVFFHFSPRYRSRPELLQAEATAAFRG